MKGSQHFWCLTALLIIVALLTSAQPTTSPSATHRAEKTQLLLISEDTIPDIENKTQKVIRVNPLDLPAFKDDPTTNSMDSSLFNIQSLKPAHHNYVNSNRMRRPRPTKQPKDAAATDSPIVRNFPEAKINKVKLKKQQQKRKQQQQQQLQQPQQQLPQLHFLYDQPALDPRQQSLLDQSMNVRVAAGAYPVYYAVSRANGHFGKYPLKGFRTQQEFMKYLLKNKVLSGNELQS